MKTVNRIFALCGLLVLSFGVPLLAAGPVDGEVSALWWANEYDRNTQTSNVSEDGGSPGLRAELWMLERYGVRASMFGSDVSDSQGADYASVDVMWKALAPTENNFVAVGLGWQQMDLQGLAQETSGMRLAVEGRFGLVGMLYGYGSASYLPDLDDAAASDPLAGRLEDIDAFEYELGLAWNALPFMNVHAGYRVNNLSFTQETIQVAGVGTDVQPEGAGGSGFSGMAPGGTAGCTDCTPNAAGDGTSGEAESAGFYLGVGFQF
jgi:hypothetical protein